MDVLALFGWRTCRETPFKNSFSSASLPTRRSRAAMRASYSASTSAAAVSLSSPPASNLATQILIRLRPIPWRLARACSDSPPRNSWTTWRLNSIECVRCLAMGFLLESPVQLADSHLPHLSTPRGALEFDRAASSPETLSEIGFAHLRAPRELVRPPGRGHAPLRQDVAVVRDGERLMHVLLDQKHRDAARIDLPDDIEILLDQDRGEPERGLVHQQELGGAHQPAADGDHRLLAARHGAGDLRAALAQSGEQAIDVLDARARHRLDGQLGKDLAAFRDAGDAGGDHPVGRQSRDLAAVEQDAARARRRQSQDR